MRMSWRNRNNFIKTNFSHLKTSRNLSRAKSAVDSMLGNSKMQSSATNNMFNSLRIDADKLEKSQKLVEGMAKLKEMHLLGNK